MAGLFDRPQQQPQQGLFGAIFSGMGRGLTNPGGFFVNEGAPAAQALGSMVLSPFVQANQAMPWGGNDPRAIGIDPQTGSIDPSVMVPWATDVAGTVTAGAGLAPPVMGGAGMGIRAYHGSPHDFDRFEISPRTSHTGEGAQAYGPGGYFAEAEGTAREYRNNVSAMRLSKAQRQASAYGNDYDAAITGLQAEIKRLKELPNAGGDAAFRDRQIASKEQSIAEINRWKKGEMSSGKMYEVDIDASPDEFLDWDKPLYDQSPKVQDFLAKKYGVPDSVKQGEGGRWYTYLGEKQVGNPRGFPTKADAEYGRKVMFETAAKPGRLGQELVGETEALRAAGVKGIRYKDAGSRGGTEGGTHNYVVFDDKTISILKKYGLAGLTAGGAGAAMLGGGTDQAQAAQPPWMTGGRF